MGRNASVMRSLMPWTVVVEMCSTMNSYGELSYQTCASYRAAIQGPQKFLHAGSQQEQVSRQTVYVGTTALITPHDRITLPSGFEVRQPPILDCTRVSDETGFHHVKLFCG